jgi:hypothetical protein
MIEINKHQLSIHDERRFLEAQKQYKGYYYPTVAEIPKERHRVTPDNFIDDLRPRPILRLVEQMAEVIPFPVRKSLPEYPEAA